MYTIDMRIDKTDITITMFWNKSLQLSHNGAIAVTIKSFFKVYFNFRQTSMVLNKESDKRTWTKYGEGFNAGILGVVEVQLLYSLDEIAYVADVTR